MDDILVNLLDEWLIYLNEFKGVVPKTKDEIVEWDMSRAYPMLTKNQLYGCLCDDDFWKRVQPVTGAYTYMKKLIDDGHEIYIATSSQPHSFFIKTQYCLFKHFDFLSPKQVICINNKSLLDGDILFDDYHENLRNFKGVRVLRNKPYNLNCDEECHHFRVDTWEEFYAIVKEINNYREDYLI